MVLSRLVVSTYWAVTSWVVRLRCSTVPILESWSSAASSWFAGTERVSVPNPVVASDLPWSGREVDILDLDREAGALGQLGTNRWHRCPGPGDSGRLGRRAGGDGTRCT